MNVCKYVHTYTYVDKPVIETVRATGGPGYVSVIWTSMKYGSMNFNIMLLSPVAMNMTITTPNNSYNFTGLPGCTQYDVTVFGTNM